MRKLLCILLACAMVLAGFPACSPKTEITSRATSVDVAETDDDIDSVADDEDAQNTETANLEFSGLNDPVLLRYVEDSVYRAVIEDLDSDEYFIENVTAVYVSQEYVDELAYNSRSNIYFGYTLAEIEEAFQGEKYVFTVGEDGETIVKAFEDYDDTYEKTVKNVAIGTGVILVCVTVSVATGGVAPAVSLIFAASAETAAEFAIGSAVISGVTAGVVTGYQTGDVDQALRSAVYEASEGFKWGAIGGALMGGGSEAVAYSRTLSKLRGVELNGLTPQQAAVIQRRTKLPTEIVKKIHLTDELAIYERAGLEAKRFSNGEWAYVRKIDLDTPIAGETNRARILRGASPVDATGRPYELHHVGQNADSPLAILTRAEHMQEGNNPILHWRPKGDPMADVEHGSSWASQRTQYWEHYLEAFDKGLI